MTTVHPRLQVQSNERERLTIAPDHSQLPNDEIPHCDSPRKKKREDVCVCEWEKRNTKINQTIYDIFIYLNGNSSERERGEYTPYSTTQQQQQPQQHQRRRRRSEGRVSESEERPDVYSRYSIQCTLQIQIDMEENNGHHNEEFKKTK